jgi:hypothetical protein
MRRQLSVRLISCFTAVSVATGLAVTPARTQAVHRGIWETRVFVAPNCPTDPAAQVEALPALLVSVLGFIIPKFVDLGVSVANQRLQAKKQEELDKNKEIVVSTVGAAGNFYEFFERKVGEGPDTEPVIDLALRNHCLVVIRGDFSRPSPVPPDDCQRFQIPALREQHACKWLQDNGVFGSSNDGNAIGIYLEARFKFSEEGTSFHLEPNHFGYLIPIRPAGQPEGQGGGHQDGVSGFYDLAFTVSFEPTGAGQTVTPFALAILPFLTLANPTFASEQPNPTVLTRSALTGKASGWTPIPPLADAQQTELKRVKDLYDTRKTLKAKIAQLTPAIAALEAKTRALMTDLSTVSISAPAITPSGNIFKDAQADATRRLNDELFDDVIQNAKLDADPTIAPAPGDTAAQATQKKIERQRKVRANQAYRAKVNDLKSAAEDGLKNLADKAQTDADLAAKESDITRWRGAPLNQDSTTKHAVGSFSVMVEIREQPYLPTNYFLLTAADLFANSKQDVSTFISQNAIQTLGLQSRDDQVKKISDQAQLVIAAMSALNAAQDAKAALDSLPPDATDQQRRAAKLALDTAKINANIAYLKAGMDAPYKDVFGGG